MVKAILDLFIKLKDEKKTMGTKLKKYVISKPKSN